MDRKSVLICVPNFGKYCSQAMNLLSEQPYEVIFNPHQRPLTHEELLVLASEAHAAIIGNERWSDNLIRSLGKMQILSRFGVGLDSLDLPACQAKGIRITRSLGANTQAVAEFTISLMLAAIRHLPYFDRTTKAGQWQRLPGLELSGKTIGLIGYGSIAQRVSQLLSGFDVRIMVHTRTPGANVPDHTKVQFAPLEKVLQESDILSLHLPGSAETTHIIDQNAMTVMKKGAVLINTARGSHIDEAALYEALTSGHLRGAALDVFSTEPTDASFKLFALDNVIVSPHTAGATLESYERMGAASAQAIVDFFQGRVLKNGFVE